MKALPALLALALTACQTQVQPQKPRVCPFRVDPTKPELLNVQNPIYRTNLDKLLSDTEPNLRKSRSHDFNNGFTAGVRDAHTIFRNAINASAINISTLLVNEQCPSCPTPQHLQVHPEEEGVSGKQNRPSAVNTQAFDAGYHSALSNMTTLFDIRKLPSKIRTTTNAKCQMTLRYLANQGQPLPKSVCHNLSQLAFQEAWKLVSEIQKPVCSSKSCSVP